MDTAKKSLEWLRPMELSSQDVEKFNKSIKKPVSAATLKKQKNIFSVAINLGSDN